MSEVITEIRGEAGLITLDRPQALNALSLDMIRELTAALLAWRQDERVKLVAIRGTGKDGPFGTFCVGGDIRFFHQAALAGDPRLEDFFNEEYSLDYLIHTYPKPYVVFMDGIVMGGGMGISGHGGAGSLRIVTERTRMAMPETSIGLFPDVGGGWFLARCPGHLGEYLALTGEAIGSADAFAGDLTDGQLPVAELVSAWEQLAVHGSQGLTALQARLGAPAGGGTLGAHRLDIDRVFALPTVAAIVAALESDAASWAREIAAVLRKRSPLMLHVVLEQVRRARSLGFADNLRMERGIMRHCFQLRPGVASETVEGIRALVIDKDQAPRWNPARIEDVTPEMVAAFFASPWPAHAHPLRDLL